MDFENVFDRSFWTKTSTRGSCRICLWLLKTVELRGEGWVVSGHQTNEVFDEGMFLLSQRSSGFCDHHIFNETPLCSTSDNRTFTSTLVISAVHTASRRTDWFNAGEMVLIDQNISSWSKLQKQSKNLQFDNRRSGTNPL